MSNGMNKVMLFGNLGADPELRKTPSGASVLKVRLATNRSWVNKDGVREDETQWHNVTIFGGRGEGLARVLRKGSFLLVEGRIQTHSYEKEGTRRFYTEIVAEDVILGGHGSRRPDAQEDHEAETEAYATADAWADVHARPAASRARPSDQPDVDPQMGLDDRLPGSDRPTAPRNDPELFDVPPSEPKPRRGEGGAGAVEAPPAPRRKPRAPAGAPAVAA
jgi:single-strand DNA-binding protein